jgi:hypothetical protein
MELLSTAVIHPSDIQEVPNPNPSCDTTVLTECSHTFSRLSPEFSEYCLNFDWPLVFLQIHIVQSYVMCGYRTSPVVVELQNNQIRNWTMACNDSAVVNDSGQKIEISTDNYFRRNLCVPRRKYKGRKPKHGKSYKNF